MQLTRNVTTPKIVTDSICRRATTHFAMFESMAELADYPTPRKQGGADGWNGHKTYEQAQDAARNGDLSLVAASDALLEKMESYELPTARNRWTDDVCGPVPNVPAFIAGHPLNMRRRRRDENAAAPLAIIVDTTSGANHSAAQIAKRGAAILALVRALSARRPVELWAGVTLDADARQNAVAIYARIDTAPLDLARAAFALTHAAYPRRLCYSLGRSHFGFTGDWPFGRGALSRAEMEAVLSPAMAHVSQTLCIPAIHNADLAINDPQGFIARELATHGAVDLDAA